MAKGASQNAFSQGLSQDYGPLSVPDQVYIDALNATLVTMGSDEFVLQTDSGNEFRSGFTPGFRPLGVSTMNGIAYFALLNPETGEGELGTYPSPDYSTGSMTLDYRPLMNWEGENPFRTPLFNFSLQRPVKIEMQRSYDGSANMVINDGENIPRIVNSRFRLKGDFGYEIADREGLPDSNLYTASNFEARTSLIPRFGTVAKLFFRGLASGGRLSCGNYRYWFRYSDQDGNLTDIFSESLDVSVFPENEGGRPAEATDSSTEFEMFSLDTSYPYIKVYFSYASSELDGNAVPEIYEIEERVSVPESGNLRYFHTGFEQTSLYDASQLRLRLSPIKSFQTITQNQGRLMGGGVSYEPLYDKDFLDFSRGLRLRSDFRDTLVAFDYQTSFERASENWSRSRDLQIAENLPEDSLGNPQSYFPKGHGNPLNIYYRKGYWDQEVYQFGISFIRKDGSRTDVYPVRGTIDGYSQDPLESDEFFSLSNGENYQGVFFTSGLTQNRISDSLGNMVEDYHTSGFSARGIRFDFSLIDPQVVMNAMSKSLGFVLMRADREPICVAEGLMLPAMSHTNEYYSEGRLGYRNRPGLASGQYNCITLMGHLENINFTGTSDLNNPAFYRLKNQKIVPDVEAREEYSEYFGPELLTSTGPFIHNGYIRHKSGIICPDQILWRSRFDPSIISESLKVRPLYEMRFASDLDAEFIPASDITQFASGTQNGPNRYLPTYYAPRKGRIYYKESGKEYYEGSSIFVTKGNSAPLDGFTSTLRLFDETEDVSIHMIAESYLGFSSDTLMSEVTGLANIIRSLNITREFRRGRYSEVPGTIVTSDNYLRKALPNDIPFPGGYIVRMYRDVSMLVLEGGGQYSIPAIRARYLSNLGESYFAITDNYSWSEVFDQQGLPINPNGLLAFGGDCYRFPFFRRVHSSPAWPQDPRLTTVFSDDVLKDEDYEGNTFDAEAEPFDIPRPIAYYTGFICNTNTNPAMRNEESNDPAEEALYGRKRPWFPYSVKKFKGISKTIQLRSGAFKLPESSGYNPGYSYIGSENYYPSVPLKAPFLRNSFPNRVAFSDPYASGSFDNGYRRFAGLNYRDYTSSSGKIVELVTHNNTLFCIMENGVAAVGVNDRTLVGQDSAGGIFVDQATVLHPKLSFISDSYGSAWQFSIARSTNTIYGVDVDSFKIWRVEGGEAGASLKLISDFSVQSELKKRLIPYLSSSSEIGSLDVRTHFDRRKHDIVFTFYKESQESFALVYNEILSKWVTYSSAIRSISFNLWDEHHSVPVSGEGIWRHVPGGSLWCNYYGEQFQFMFEYVIVDNPSLQKMYNNLKIIGNNSLPIRVVYRNDNDSVVQDTVRRNNSNILAYDMDYKENHCYLYVYKNGNKRIRDKYCKVKVVYTGSDFTFVNAVLNYFTYSFS